MPSENRTPDGLSRPPADQRGADAGDLVLAALDFLRRGLSGDGEPSRPPPLARQESGLLQWADGLGLLLNPADLPGKVIRGCQEHELFHDESSDRYLKVTRNGVFGLSPGIELALVSSAEDARRFHLWEASPVEYLERLHLQNLLVPGLNRLEGVIYQANGELAIVTSQPRFDIIPVSVPEIASPHRSSRQQATLKAPKLTASGGLGMILGWTYLHPCQQALVKPQGKTSERRSRY
ncbi:MAG: hypothetical protein MUF31_11835 [Akkermansiaceae bacterium]|jgi:hypothetical protein|nr:hypothetical protein [Akkermansiaceae bacterium]